jgi:hypothetical protein
MGSVTALLSVILAWAKTEAAVRMIMQIVAWLLNWAAKKYLLDRGRGNDVAFFSYLAEKLSECSAVFSRIVADGVITDDESDEATSALMPVLEAWSKREPTPQAYKDKVAE